MGTLTLDSHIIQLPGLSPNISLDKKQALLLLEVGSEDTTSFIELFKIIGQFGTRASGKIRDEVLTRLTKTNLVIGVVKDGRHEWELTTNGRIVVNTIKEIVALEIEAKETKKAIARAQDFETRMKSGYYSIDNDTASEFHDDLLKEYGVIDNPKANQAYNLAWQYGYSSGYHEVYNYFDDLVELIK